MTDAPCSSTPARRLSVYLAVGATVAAMWLMAPIVWPLGAILGARKAMQSKGAE